MFYHFTKFYKLCEIAVKINYLSESLIFWLYNEEFGHFVPDNFWFLYLVLSEHGKILSEKNI